MPEPFLICATIWEGGKVNWESLRGCLARLFLFLLERLGVFESTADGACHGEYMKWGYSHLWVLNATLAHSSSWYNQEKRQEGCCYLPTFVCRTGQQRIKGEQEKQSNSCQQCTKLRRERTDGNSFDARNPSATAPPYELLEILCGRASETGCEKQKWVWVAWEKMEERVALLVEGTLREGSCPSAQLLVSPKIGLWKVEATQLYRTTCKAAAPWCPTWNTPVRIACESLAARKVHRKLIQQLWYWAAQSCRTSHFCCWQHLWSPLTLACFDEQR